MIPWRRLLAGDPRCPHPLHPDAFAQQHAHGLVGDLGIER
jgi:hypothetical protein